MLKDKLIKPKFIEFISMMYVSFITFCAIVGYKPIQTQFDVNSAASYLSPFWFILGDIIAEVYGFKESLIMFISSVITEIIFAPIVYMLIHLPSPPDWHQQAAYDLIVGSLPKIFFLGIIGNILAWPINSFFLTRWKKMTHGKYFWWRSIKSSALGLSIFTIFSVTLSLVGMVKSNYIFSMVLWSLVLKLAIVCVFALPSNIIVFYLKRIEKIDIYDNNYKFKNPFKRKKL